MTEMTLRFTLLALALTATGCGVTTRTTVQRGAERTCVLVEQQKWGMHLLEPALNGLSIQFPSGLADRPGVIPASCLGIQDTSRLPAVDDNQTPWAGYINYDRTHRGLDIRLYQRRVDVYGHEYFAQHPLNGVFRVNCQTQEK
jgi:hypothetical protein